jgi:hypothetical protein
MQTTDPDRFAMAVQNALAKEVEAIICEEAERAAEEVKKRVKQITANVALSCLGRYDISMNGTTLLIKVDNG